MVLGVSRLVKMSVVVFIAQLTYISASFDVAGIGTFLRVLVVARGSSSLFSHRGGRNQLHQRSNRLCKFKVKKITITTDFKYLFYHAALPGLSF